MRSTLIAAALLACSAGAGPSTAPETGGELVPSQGIDSLQVPSGLRVNLFATVSGARVLKARGVCRPQTAESRDSQEKRSV